MIKTDYKLIAHELGHAIYGYLYESTQYPTSLSLVTAGSIVGCVEFEDWTGLPVVDESVARIKGNSYLGGMFGEMIWDDTVRIKGIRGDMDEFLTELTYLGKPGKWRTSRSKLFKELWGWFYTDHDSSSFGGIMKRWFENARDPAGKTMTSAQIENRLPETWRLYEKFLTHIDADAFRVACKDIAARQNKVLYRRTLQMYARRIIPDTVMHPEDI